MKKRSTRTETHSKRVQPLSKSQSQTFSNQKHEFYNQRKLTSSKSNLYDQLSSVFNVLLPANLAETRPSSRKANAFGDYCIRKKSRPKSSDEFKAKNTLKFLRIMGDEGDAPAEEGGDAATTEQGGEEDVAEAAEEGETAVDSGPENVGETRESSAPKETKDADRQGNMGSTISNFPLVDSAVLEELRNADAKATKTSKLIESMKLDIVKLQQKKDMNEEDIQNLRKMHDALNEKLSEFENIAKNIQDLLGIAELTPSKLALTRSTPFEKPVGKGEQGLLDGGEEKPEIKVQQKDQKVQLTESETEKLKELETKLPKVIICGTGKEGEVPKIIVCEPVREQEKMTRSLTDKLSESYKMQEKLVDDNARMEGSRYELQEQLLSRDKTVESLQKQLESLQKEKKLMAKENAELQKKAVSPQKLPSSSPCPSCVTFCCAPPNLDPLTCSDREMERKLELIEEAVRHVKNEVLCVQEERRMLQTQTQMLQCAFAHQPACQKETAYQHNQGVDNFANKELEANVKELTEKHNTLNENFNDKIAEIACLRTMLKNYKIENETLAERCSFAEARADDLLERCRVLELEKQSACIARNQFIDMEQQLNLCKQQMQNIKEEKETLAIINQEQGEQINDYKNKYLDAQQIVEEQKRGMERTQLQCSDIKDRLLTEVNQFKKQIQDKVNDLSTLADKLKTCETKLMISKKNIEDLTKELNDTKELNNMLANSTSREEHEKKILDLQNDLAERDLKIGDLIKDNTEMRAMLTRFEAIFEDQQLCNEERMSEITQLQSQISTIREEAARQVVKTKERCETVRKLMLAQISSLEKQLAESRACSNAAAKERDEIRAKMEQQITNLGDNFSQAQTRIRCLQEHINFLKASPTCI